MEENRYERHFLLDGFGRDGQKKLSEAKVLIVGVGGLGSPVAMYLASAGIGKIGLIDADVVDVTNLQRQIIHSESSVGVDKVVSAKSRIAELNSETEVITYNFFFDVNNAESIAGEYDFIVNAEISSESNYDSGYVIVDEISSETAQEDISYDNQQNPYEMININGATSSQDYTTTLYGGKKYVIYFIYSSVYMSISISQYP